MLPVEPQGAAVNPLLLLLQQLLLLLLPLLLLLLLRPGLLRPPWACGRLGCQLPAARRRRAAAAAPTSCCCPCLQLLLLWRLDRSWLHGP
jgi:hypothetical protein